MTDPSGHRSVLIIGASSQQLSSLMPILQRRDLNIDHAESTMASLDLVSAVRFDLIVIGFPLDDMPDSFLLNAIRNKESASRRSGVLLVSTDADVAGALALLGRGANGIVTERLSDGDIEEQVGSLLSIAPRASVSLQVNVTVHLADGKLEMISHTENLSTTGMLVRATSKQPIGAKVEFSLTLPEQTHPITGIGRVVRHTTSDREHVSGIGIQFDDVSDHAISLLDRYLDALID